jgi:tRNA U55 pseudouridine synthase TruB
MALQTYAPTVYEALNGVFCVYKPAGSSVRQLLHALRTNLSRELNQLPCRLARQRVVISEHKEVDSSNNLPAIKTEVDFSDHPLVSGQRYIEDDFDMASVDSLATGASGVQVLAIGRGLSRLRLINQARYLRVYHVKGQFGLATQDFTPTGKIIEKTTYKHVSRARLDRITAAIQAGHQKQMFKSAGVDLQSQEAYDLACQGLLRPVAQSDKSTLGPVLYGIRCIHFHAPDFTLEIHAVNESSVYLMKLVHEIGIELRSTAVCTGLRRLRYGHFTLAHALLTKHCDARSITENIEFCRPIVTREVLRRRLNVISCHREQLAAVGSDHTQDSNKGGVIERQFVDDVDSLDNIIINTDSGSSAT